MEDKDYQLFVDDFLKQRIFELATRPLFFDMFLKAPKPWPWYKRWMWYYWHRPLSAIRHSVCCGGDHGDYRS